MLQSTQAKLNEGTLAGRALKAFILLPAASRRSLDLYYNDYMHREFAFIKARGYLQSESIRDRWQSDKKDYGCYGKFLWRRDNRIVTPSMWDRILFSLPRATAVITEKALRFDLHTGLLICGVIGAFVLSSKTAIEDPTIVSMFWVIGAPLLAFVGYSIHWYFQPLSLAFIIAFFLINFSQSYFDRLGLTFVENVVAELLSSPGTALSVASILTLAFISTLVDALDAI
ncbi:MAG: hypothetical protein ACJASC_002849 [Limimaricola cinnabarinus]|jgi:hypothetical protein|uniref:hypothetical protein n=1 Tax=Limimaricola cinnabarinus TaxID=1125964 RepID=UPI0039E534BB